MAKFHEQLYIVITPLLHIALLKTCLKESFKRNTFALLKPKAYKRKNILRGLLRLSINYSMTAENMFIYIVYMFR